MIFLIFLLWPKANVPGFCVGYYRVTTQPFLLYINFVVGRCRKVNNRRGFWWFWYSSTCRFQIWYFQSSHLTPIFFFNLVSKFSYQRIFQTSVVRILLFVQLSCRVSIEAQYHGESEALIIFSPAVLCKCAALPPHGVFYSRKPL